MKVPVNIKLSPFVKDLGLRDHNRQLMLNMRDQDCAYGGENLPSLDAVSLFPPVNTDD